MTSLLSIIKHHFSFKIVLDCRVVLVEFKKPSFCQIISLLKAQLVQTDAYYSPKKSRKRSQTALKNINKYIPFRKKGQRG
jgi:hypothetical protein